MCNNKSVSEHTPARINFSAISGVILRAWEKVWLGEILMRAFYRNRFACGDLQVVVIASDGLSEKQSIPPSID